MPDSVKIDTTAGGMVFDPPSAYDGILCLQIGGLAALRILEVLENEETQQSSGAMLGIVTTAPEFVRMCGALVGLSWTGKDLGVKRGADLEAYGADVVRALEQQAGLSFTDVIVCGSILYRHVQGRIALDQAALERANFTERIRDGRP